jgi:hypothetical protein
MDKEELNLLSEICDAISKITAMMEIQADEHTSLAEMGIKFNCYAESLRDRIAQLRVFAEVKVEHRRNSNGFEADDPPSAHWQ